MSGIYRWNLNPFIALFLSFFFTKIRREVDKSLRKLGDIKADTASIARKRTRLGRRVLRHKLAQGCAFSCIMTCFSCATMVFGYSKRARTFFTKYVPSRSFGGHVTWNSAVPDPNVWCCKLLFLCTLVNSNCLFLHSHDASADKLLKDQKSCHLLKCGCFHRRATCKMCFVTCSEGYIETWKCFQSLQLSVFLSMSEKRERTILRSTFLHVFNIRIQLYFLLKKYLPTTHDCTKVSW